VVEFIILPMEDLTIKRTFKTHFIETNFIPFIYFIAAGQL